jgi:hypothetical protein
MKDAEIFHSKETGLSELVTGSKQNGCRQYKKYKISNKKTFHDKKE